MGQCAGKASREVVDESASCTGRAQSNILASTISGKGHKALSGLQNGRSREACGGKDLHQAEELPQLSRKVLDDANPNRIVDASGVDLEILPPDATNLQQYGLLQADGSQTDSLLRAHPEIPAVASMTSTISKPQSSPNASPQSTTASVKQTTSSASPSRSPRTPSSSLASLFTTRKARESSKPPEPCIIVSMTKPLLVHIISLLDLADAASLMSTCTLFHSFIRDDKLWEEQILQQLRLAVLQCAAPGPYIQDPHSSSSSSNTDEHVTPFTPIHTAAHSNGWGFKMRAAPKHIEHKTGPRWLDAAAAFVATNLQDDPVVHLSHLQAVWTRLLGESPPFSLQNLCYALATGGSWSRPLSRLASQLQGTFEVVLPGAYEVLWWLRLKHVKMASDGYMRFDTCIQYCQVAGEPVHSVEYGNKSTIWNAAQWHSLEQKHGKGVWFSTVVTTLRVSRPCKVEVSLKGLDDCSGLWAKMVQLRRVVDTGSANGLQC